MGLVWCRHSDFYFINEWFCFSLIEKDWTTPSSAQRHCPQEWALVVLRDQIECTCSKLGSAACKASTIPPVLSPALHFFHCGVCMHPLGRGDSHSLVVNMIVVLSGDCCSVKSCPLQESHFLVLKVTKFCSVFLIRGCIPLAVVLTLPWLRCGHKRLVLKSDSRAAKLKE